MMMGRPILRKQVGYRMYRPAAVAVANTLSDIPFSALRVLVFDIIIYFMAHLDRSAGGFFVFHLFNYMAFLAVQGFFRTLGLLCSRPDSAIRIATIFFPNLLVAPVLLAASPLISRTSLFPAFNTLDILLR